jgi:hypothetical protein
MAKAVHYWTLIEPVWLSLNRNWDDGAQKFLRQFRRVAPEVGHLYAGHWCQSEVCNGGFFQFFGNTTGLLAPEALAGFQAIGVREWAEILAEAMKHFGTPHPRDRFDRFVLLPMPQQGPSEQWNPFCKLNQRFFEWTEKWEDTANDYAARVVAKGGG